MTRSSPTNAVAPDGSPVAVYLALPPHDALDLVADQVPPSGSVLDLGCGVGRLANPLSERGVVVTGVDDHAAMLEHLTAAVEPVLADIATLDLGRTFDVVVLASHLVNHSQMSAAFLAASRRHVVDGGDVLIERFHPDMLDDLDQREGVMDGVRVRHEVLHRAGVRFSASVHYTVGDATWVQRYEAMILDDEAFDQALRAAGLMFGEWLDDHARWARARPLTNGGSPSAYGRSPAP